MQEDLDSHTHAIADVSGLQNALDGKAASSHGTHVSYSTTAPVMDGTASAGSASTVARSDHKHPTDTSRAAKSDFDSHTGNTTIHITSTERTNWNTAKTTAESAQTRADSAYSLAEGKVDSLSDLGITATAAELNYMDGVTANVQTQLDEKLSASNPIGSGSLSLNRKVSTTVGTNSVALGTDTIASGNSSIAVGCYNSAMSRDTKATGTGSVAMGNGAPEAKEAAKFVTKDIGDHGILYAIEYYSLLR